MLSKDKPREGSELQIKIINLTVRLEEAMDTLKLAHAKELENLTLQCREGIQSLHDSFTERLDQLQKTHESEMTGMGQEIQYLKEMTQSQRLMMEDNVLYIKELEERFPGPNNSTTPEG